MQPGPLSPPAFADAVTRAARRRARPVVVKLGGSAMEDPAATADCLRSVATLHQLGLRMVLVHGGGKPIDRAMAEAGITPRKVAGRRYTDDATLEIVVRVLGRINDDLVARLRDLHCPARGYTTAAGFPLLGERLTLTDAAGAVVDLGRVGRIAGAREAALLDCLATGVAVVPSLAVAADGGWLNVNADTAAAGAVGAVGAQTAVFLTDTPGVLRDRADPASLIPSLSRRECQALIAAGVIDGGMTPKVEACFDALDAGAEAALVLDGRVSFSLLDVFIKDRFTGTTITR